MRPYILVGDPTDHDGVVKTGNPRHLHQGRAVACVGDLVSCPKHGECTIVTGEERNLLDGQARAREGDLTECGARLIATQREFGSVG